MTPENIPIFGQHVDTDTAYFSFSVWDDIPSKELQKLLKLTHIRHLNVSSCDLEDKHLETIGKLKTLELLDLDSTEISDHGLSFLEPLQQLKQLRLKDNPQLTDNCIDYLVRIPSLEMLHAGNTSITSTGLSLLLDRVQLKTLILDSEFADSIADLLDLSGRYPDLEIILKGTGCISNGRMNN